MCWAPERTIRPSEAVCLFLFLPAYTQEEARQSLLRDTNLLLLSIRQIQRRQPGLGWGSPLAFITKFKPLKAYSYSYSSLSWDFWDPAGAAVQR